MDTQIRIHTKMSWILNIDFGKQFHRYFPSKNIGIFHKYRTLEKDPTRTFADNGISPNNALILAGTTDKRQKNVSIMNPARSGIPLL
jgi:hypothetical protein